MSFNEDLKDEVIRAASIIGLKIRSEKKLEIVVQEHLTVRHKLIPVKKRKILICPIFEKSIQLHQKKGEIKTIIEDATKIKNLNKYQSKRLLHSNFHDHLVSSWNIYHFHLSTERDKKRPRFVKQVNSLLFAYIDDEHIIFLGVDTHKESIFSDIKWLSTLHNHFPFILDKFRIDDIIGIEHQLTNKEREELWKHGISDGIIEIDGTFYHTPGLGRVSTGHNTNVVLQLNETLRWLERINNQFSEIKNLLEQQYSIKNFKPNFKLRIGSHTLEIVEINTNSILVTYPNFFNPKKEIEFLIYFNNTLQNSKYVKK